MAKHVVCLAGIGLLVSIGAAAPQSATLPQIFPELADLPEAATVGIVIDWMGLSPLSPMTAGYVLKLHGEQFEGEGTFHVGRGPSEKRTIAIPRDRVRAFLAAAARVPLVEAQYHARVEHTDDYPTLDIQVLLPRGLLDMGSSSQHRQPASGDYVDRTPWHIDYAKRNFVVTASDLDQAFEALEPYLRDQETLDELAKKLETAR